MRTYARPEQGGNLTYLQVVLGYIVARCSSRGCSCRPTSSGDLLTAYELLQRRFGTRREALHGVAVPAHAALAEGVRVFAASLVLSAVISDRSPAFRTCGPGRSSSSAR